MLNFRTPFLLRLDEAGPVSPAGGPLGHIAPFLPVYSKNREWPGDPYPEAFRLPSLPLPLLMRVAKFNRRMAFPRLTPAPKTYKITGVTRDSAGTELGNCVVKLFRTTDDVEIDQVNSDASGNFIFSLGVSPQIQQYAVAYLAGSPDRAGTTVNTLTGA